MEKTKMVYGTYWTLEERLLLRKCIDLQMKVSGMDIYVGRLKNSIRNELRKFGGDKRLYDPIVANERAEVRLKCRGRNQSEVEFKLSQEQIALFKMGYSQGFSIYKIACLAQCGTRRVAKWLEENKDELPEINAITFEDRIKALEMVVGMLSKAIRKINEKLTGEKDV